MELLFFLNNFWRGLGLWCLMSLSTIFQLYRGGHFCWWRKPLTCRKSLANFTKYTYILKVNPQTLFAYHIRAPDKLRICVFCAMKTSKNAYIIRSECTHYAYILLCKQTFQIRSVLVQSCT